MERYWIHTGHEDGADVHSATIKRSADTFAVTEIDPSGAAVRLTENTAPPDPPEFVSKYLEWKEGAHDAAAPLEVDEVIHQMHTLVAPETLRLIEAFEKDDNNLMEIGPIADKDKRRHFVVSLRNEFPSLSMLTSNGIVSIERCPTYPNLVAAFGSANAGKIVNFAMSSARTPFQIPYTTESKEIKREVNKTIGIKFGVLILRARDGVCTVSKKPLKRKKCEVDQPFTHFTLWKKGVSWFEAIRIICREAGCHENDLASAGVKDKHAVTTQRCSIKGVYGGTLSALQEDRVKVCDIQYEKEPLCSGQLSGNIFAITLDDVDGCLDSVRTRADQVFSVGFPNCFGTQRFSYINQRDLHMGEALVKQQWERCIEILMTSTSQDSPEITALKDSYQTADLKTLARDYPSSRVAEKNVLFAKSRKPDDPAEWFNAVPYLHREMWVHSFQSWVWNKVLWKRMGSNGVAGLKVLVGDLVMPPRLAGGDNSKQVPEVCTDPSKYTIYDVVHPKPGGPSLFPDNEVGVLFDEVLAEYDLERTGWTQSGIRLAASYRHIVVRPGEGGLDINETARSAVATFALPPAVYATVCLGSIMNTILS